MLLLKDFFNEQYNVIAKASSANHPSLSFWIACGIFSLFDASSIAFSIADNVSSKLPFILFF